MSTQTEDQKLETTESVQDAFTLDEIRKAVAFAKTGARARTTANLGVAGCIARVIEHTVLAVAKSRADVKLYRSQSIALFSVPCSQATGDSWTVSRLNEALNVHYFAESLPSDVKPMVDAINWESLRTLARWAIHNAGEDLFETGASYLEAWTLKTGCEEHAANLVRSLAVAPQGRADLIADLDAHELALSGKAAPDTDDDDKAALAFLRSVRVGRDKLGWSKARLLTELLGAKVVDVNAIMKVVAANATAPEPSQPNKRATATVDDSGVKRDDPLKHPAAQTRVVSQPVSAAA